MTEQSLPKVHKEYGGYTDIANAMSDVHRTVREQGFRRQQVHMWWVRRTRNGFPEKHKIVLNGRKRELLKLSEVLDWYEGYVPSTGGRRAASES